MFAATATQKSANNNEPVTLAILKSQSNGPLCSSMVIGTLAVDGWTVTFGTARRGLGGLQPCPGPSSLYQINSPPSNGQCTNFILFNSMWHYN